MGGQEQARACGQRMQGVLEPLDQQQQQLSASTEYK